MFARYAWEELEHAKHPVWLHYTNNQLYAEEVLFDLEKHGQLLSKLRTRLLELLA